MIEMSHLWKKGLPPVQGGVLDQSSSFVEAHRFIDSERARYRTGFEALLGEEAD